jgi:amino acid transporter
MAAIFALVFVPALAAVLFLVGNLQGHLTLAGVAAGATFVALITGILTGLFRMSRAWDEDTHTHT